ncbi:hypothetical protein [Methylobacterium indicum]|uniref:Uncharacterized protein n=1 Tax=Methylobacterium indicum TaxID=1775910 RepID=A0ABR5HIH6_9HYPH|nr:hypothetical protein [Methylobacterium indicum]KMO11417.1 hypothetical protein QR78_28540 [Methylobacterium indicum]KMO26388.1 hypothetical protein QR79_02735 [Methylobacterium indicum]
MTLPSSLPTLSRSDQINQLTHGYGQLAVDLVAEGWAPYLLVLKFRHLGGRRDTVLAQMQHDAERAHRWLCERVWRNANAPSRRPWRPCWILAPDYPVAKRAKVSVRSLVPNDGLHLQGVAVMPPCGRLCEPLDEHLGESGARYCPRGGPLTSITATPIVAGDVAYVNTYNFKALPRGRASFDDILVLPPSSAELDSKPRPATDPWRDPIFERN